MDSIKVIATWVVSSGGAGYLAFWLIGLFHWPADFPSEVKRYLAFALTGAIAVIVWAGATWVFSEPFPATPQLWVAQIVSVMMTAIVASQVTHAKVTLHAADKALRDARSGDDIPEM